MSSIVFAASTGADCEPENDLFALQSALGGTTGVIGAIAGYYLFREHPVSVSFVPLPDGGGTVVFGGRF